MRPRSSRTPTAARPRCQRNGRGRRRSRRRAQTPQHRRIRLIAPTIWWKSSCLAKSSRLEQLRLRVLAPTGIDPLIVVARALDDVDLARWRRVEELRAPANPPSLKPLGGARGTRRRACSCPGGVRSQYSRSRCSRQRPRASQPGASSRSVTVAVAVGRIGGVRHRSATRSANRPPRRGCVCRCGRRTDGADSRSSWKSASQAASRRGLCADRRGWARPSASSAPTPSLRRTRARTSPAGVVGQ